MLRKFSAALTGGLVAALLMTTGLAYAGSSGVLGRFGVHLHGGVTQSAFLPEVCWGGAWGLLLLLPLLQKQLVLQGVIVGLVPAAFTLVYRLPVSGHAMLGLQGGVWTPLVILLLWVFWGVVAACWMRNAA